MELSFLESKLLEALPLVQPRVTYLDEDEKTNSNNKDSLMGDLSELLPKSVLDSLNPQDQLDEVIRWLHDHKLNKSIDCLIDEYYSKAENNKQEVILPSFPINKLSNSFTQEATLLSVRKHPSKNLIVMSDSRKNLMIINNEGEMLSSILDIRLNNPFAGSIIATDFHPFLDLLLIGTMDENHAILKLKNNKLDDKEEITLKVLEKFKLHEKYVVRTKWSPDGKFFVTASHDKTIGIYSFDIETLKSTFLHQMFFIGAVEAIQFTPDSSKVIVATRDDSRLNYVSLSDYAKITCSMNDLGDGHISFTPLEIIVSNDGKSVLVSTDNNTAILFRIGTPHQIRKFYGFKNDGMSQPKATFDSHNFLYLTSQDNNIYVFDVEKDRHVGVLEGHKNVVRDVTFDEVNDQLISISYDKTIKFWKRDY